jgi:FAD/FMN-containing dehydrogenase
MGQTIVNDVHSRLTETRVREVCRPASIDEAAAVVRRVAGDGGSLATCGARHAMGGQQFLSGATLLDMSGCDRVLSMDHDRGLITVEAGITWPALMDWYLEAQRRESPDRPPRWGIAQKQTGADRLTLGGALAANAHGRGLTMAPIVGDVESFTLICPDGSVITCSRETHRELFALAIGGYGLFGVIATVTLRLAPRRVLRRVVRIIDIDEAAHAARRRVEAGFLYGDFQFDVDPASPDFLTRGVFSCYQPVEGVLPPRGQKVLEPAAWERLLLLAHTDKARAFAQYAQHYLATDGQLYWSDEHQRSTYIDEYHGAIDRATGAAHPGSEVITELYVPHERLIDFLHDAARDLTQRRAEVIYGTIRLIRKDEETFLAWAKAPYACVIFNLHVQHEPGARQRAAEAFRALIDLALERSGSFFLTYHRHATRAQLLGAYPSLPAFLRAKQRVDPRGVFSSDWHRWLCETLDARA